MSGKAPKVFTLAGLRDNWPDDGNAPRLAVLGDPVAHSLSPPMHDAGLAACGFPGRYGRLHVRTEELAEALTLLPARRFLGANLTIPHKTLALGMMDGGLDDSARRLGAVNTVRVEPGGKLRGFNTDGPGFERAVGESFGVGLGSLRVMVLGAGGGAGRALATQCAGAGCTGVSLVNRTAEKARALAAELSGAAVAVPWEDGAVAAALRETDLLVNASAVGLRAEDPCPVPPGSLRPGLCVFDAVYRRDGTPTALVAAARATGARTADGLALLLHQGVLAFETWFGRPAPVEVMRAALVRAGTPGGTA